MNLTKTILVAFLCLLFIPLARASQETHGGDVILCPQKDPQVLDHYVASLPTFSDPDPIVDIHNKSTQEVIELFRQRLQSFYFGQEFDKALQAIGPIENWTLTTHLKDIGDDGLPFSLPEGCELIQAAVRSGAMMYLEQELVQKMSPAQLGVLVVHEALYYMATNRGKTTSESTRQIVKALLLKKFNLEYLHQMVMNMGYALYVLEEMSHLSINNPNYTLQLSSVTSNQYALWLGFRLRNFRYNPIQKELILTADTLDSSGIVSKTVQLDCNATGDSCVLPHTLYRDQGVLLPKNSIAKVLNPYNVEFHFPDGTVAVFLSPNL